MLTAILALTVMSVIFGLLLGLSAIYFKVESDPVVVQV